MRRVHAILAKTARAGAAAACLAALAACSTVGGDADAGKPAQKSEGFATKLLLGNANPPPVTPPEDLAIKRQCPPVEVLQGAAAFPVYDTPGSTDPFALRYQATLADTARECSSLGVEAGVRIGVVGRVILGPKGAPGAFRLPLRVAIVDDQNRPVYSQNHLIDVTVPAGQTQADFSHIEDNIVVPIPENRFAGWRILVGYDPAGATPSRAPRAKR
ncbi:hypothetical protein [Hansschlegelia sp.]|uniref:hypothetical protein n=1 Tax=Hansschlegelia sp. TaxID=2041892 RepID=UPI002CEA5AF8|nr:hypothetical protein [Hansschlegelia sp.]HVI29886.1 hypothetical protein [Hansschlegelia sp.]